MNSITTLGVTSCAGMNVFLASWYCLHGRRAKDFEICIKQEWKRVLGLNLSSVSP